ncbi:MAG: DMT family transporter [Rhodospirillaceae bacterium]
MIHSRRWPALLRPALLPWLRYWHGLPGNARGALWILGTAFLAACMGALIKFVGRRIPVFEILFIRQMIVLAVLSPVIVQHHRTVFKTNYLKLHVMRGLFAVVAMSAGFTAMVHMPLAEAVAISFARTLFLTLLAIIFLREVVGIRRWSVTIIGFIGVLVIVRPGTEHINAYAWLALVSAMFVAALTIVLRKLSQVEPASTIMAYQSSFITLIMAGPAFYFWVPPTWQELALILVIGALMSTMQWSNIQGLKVAEAVAVAPIEYTRLLFAGIIGIIFFAEIPTVWTLAGSTIIIGSTLYTIHRNALRKRTRGPDDAAPAP